MCQKSIVHLPNDAFFRFYQVQLPPKISTFVVKNYLNNQFNYNIKRTL